MNDKTKEAKEALREILKVSKTGNDGDLERLKELMDKWMLCIGEEDEGTVEVTIQLRK